MNIGIKLYSSSPDFYTEKTPATDTKSINQQLYKPEPLTKPRTPSKGFQFFTITHPPTLSGFRENQPVEKAIPSTTTTTSIPPGEKGAAFSLQTFRFPSFTSEQIIFPHFSNAKENVEPQGSSSQTQQSWRAFFRTNKSPKVVELGNPRNTNYLTENKAQDENKASSSQLNQNVKFSPPLEVHKEQEATTAECITTAEANVLHATAASDDSNSPAISTTTFTPSRLVEVLPSAPTRLRASKYTHSKFITTSQTIVL